MEYKRCIKITDNKLTDLREFAESLVNIDTNDTAWGWENAVTLQARIKDAMFKMGSDKYIRLGTRILPLMYANYTLNTDGSYNRYELTFGYTTDGAYIYIDFVMLLNSNTIVTYYNEL